MVKQEKINKKSIEIDIGEVVEYADPPRTFQIAPNVVEPPPASGKFVSKFIKNLFFANLLAFAILVAFLSFRGFPSKIPTFRPRRYFVPLLSSIALSALISLLCLLYTLRFPAKSLKHSLWISPLSTCLVGILLMVHSTSGSFAFGAPALALAITQSFYACWISSRLPYAYQILSVSVSHCGLSAAAGLEIVFAIAMATVYSGFWAIGVGGIAAHGVDRYDTYYILMLLLSLAWTLQVVRNVVHVAISHIAHARLNRRAEISVHGAFKNASTKALGDVCIGSALTPIVEFVRGTARTMGLLVGGTDECMFSCTDCYQNLADQLVAVANRWGFVHVATCHKGFVKASEDTWEMFRQRRMETLIDLDLTGSFCFLCGTTGGAISALLGGSWMLAVDNDHATEVTVYAFIIGYFIMRIAMAWPQSCVSAYHVAYAEGPDNGTLGYTIPTRLRELEASVGD